RGRRTAAEETALPLGVEDVEGERRLTRATHSSDCDELVLRYVDPHVLQIVLPRAQDADQRLGLVRARAGRSIRTPPLTCGRPERLPQRPPCERLERRDVLGRPFTDQLPALGAGFWPEIDD